MRALWDDPAFRERISAQMKARWADPAYSEHARSFHRDDRTYRWQHIESADRLPDQARNAPGTRPAATSLDGLAAGRIQTSRGWRMAPRSLLGESPRWIFP